MEWIAAAIAAVLLMFVTAVWRIAVKSQTPRRAPNDVEPDFPYESIEFASGEERIRGWWIPAPKEEGGSSPVLVLAHGWGSNRSRMLRYADPLHQAGYTLLLYDARSHGDSDSIPAPSALMFRDDVTAAVKYARSRVSADQRIGVLGHSLGGLGAILALFGDAPIDAVATDSTPVRLSTMVRAELERRKVPRFPLVHLIPSIWLRRAQVLRQEYRRMDAVEAIKQSPVPVMIIHSHQDSFIPPSEMEYIQGRAGDAGDFRWINSVGHSASETDPVFWDHLLPFFRQHLVNSNQEGGLNS